MAAGYAERSDPLNRFRELTSEALTLYYYGHDRDEVSMQGFREPRLTGYGNEKTRPGIELAERPPRLTAYERALKVELPEPAVLAYEWPQESDEYWRIFRAPPQTLNRVLGYGEVAISQTQSQTRDDLVARLSDAEQRRSTLRLKMQAHAASIDETRDALGNPFFYSGKAQGDPESRSRFTGYASHEPAFQLWQELRDLDELIADIRRQLQAR